MNGSVWLAKWPAHGAEAAIDSPLAIYATMADSVRLRPLPFAL